MDMNGEQSKAARQLINIALEGIIMNCKLKET